MTPYSSKITQSDWQALQTLEEGLWRADVRFDLAKMEESLAPDFFEYGCSSRIYQRADTLAIPPADEIPAVLPLPDFDARLLGENIAQITYISILDYPNGQQRCLRSSIWSRTETGWQLRFHQGTPLQPLNTPA